MFLKSWFQTNIYNHYIHRTSSTFCNRLKGSSYSGSFTQKIEVILHFTTLQFFYTYSISTKYHLKIKDWTENKSQPNKQTKGPARANITVINLMNSLEYFSCAYWGRFVSRCHTEVFGMHCAHMKQNSLTAHCSLSCWSSISAELYCMLSYYWMHHITQNTHVANRHGALLLCVVVSFCIYMCFYNV